VAPNDIGAVSTGAGGGLMGQTSAGIGHTSSDLIIRSRPADHRHIGGLTDALAQVYEGANMKARMYQLFSVMALFALWIDPIFNGVKW
jgi:hypothetical protein